MTRRALVVDDDRTMVRTLTDVLRLKGWYVACAYDGVEAVQAAKDETFDVVIMDVRMPMMDGVSAFKAMKKARPDTRVVLMTAYAAQELIAEAERGGVLRVMPKPVDVASLLSLLTASLSRQKPILLVDSDLMFLKSMSEVLRLRGFETVLASTLDEATAAIDARRPAAVLLHLHIGAANPRELLTAVHDASPAVALIVYSGKPGAEAEIEDALPAEWVHAFLQKPFAIDQITGVLDGIASG